MSFGRSAAAIAVGFCSLVIISPLAAQGPLAPQPASPSPARPAQPKPPAAAATKPQVVMDPKEVAQRKKDGEAFDRGVRLIQQNRFEEARVIFEDLARRNDKEGAVRNNLAFCYRKLGDNARAESEGKRAVALLPNDPGPLRGLTDLYLSQKRFNEALPLLRRLAVLEPRNVGYRRTMAQIEAQSGDLVSAERHLREASRLTPNDPAVRRGLIGIYVAQKNDAAALREQRELARILPKDARVQFDLGVRLSNAGRSKEALAAFEKSAALDPKNDLAKRNIARLQMQLKQPTAAAATYRKILAANPKDPEANFGMGLDAYNRKDWPAAEKYFRNALTYGSATQRTPARINLGLALSNQTDKAKQDEAIKVFEQVVKEAPKNPTGYSQLAALQSRTGNWRAATETYRKWTAVAPNSVDAWNALGTAAMFSGDRNTQLAAYQKLYALRPDDASRTSLASAYMSRQGTDQAVALYRPLVAKSPKYHEDIARLLLQAGQPDEGLKELQAWTAAEPRSAAAWEALGNSYRDQNRYDDARAAYTTVKSVDPKIAAPYVRIAETYTREGKRDEALKELEAAPKTAKDIASAYRLAGSTYETQNKPAEAAAAYARAAEADPKDTFSANNSARLLVQAGKTDEAIKRYEALLKENPKSPDLQGDYASALEKSGNKTTAIAAYRKVGTLSPFDATWARNAARLLDEQGNTKEAVTLLQGVMVKNPSDNLTGADYIRLAEKGASLDQAIGILVKNADKAPPSPIALRLVADAYTTQDNRSGVKVTMDGKAPASGIEVLKNYVRKFADSDIPLQTLENYSRSRGHLDVTADCLRQMSTRRPTDTSLPLQIADVLEQSGDVRGAIVETEMVVRRDPTNAAARRRLARLYEADGRPVDARAEWETAGRLAANDPDVVKALARLPAPVGLAPVTTPTRPFTPFPGSLPPGLNGTERDTLRLPRPPVPTGL